MQAFIPKDDQALPDSYTITIHYLNGKTDKLELASHTTRDLVKVYDPEGKIQTPTGRFNLAPSPVPVIECVTKDNIWHWINLGAVARIEFDSSFSKIVDLQKEKNDLKKE